MGTTSSTGCNIVIDKSSVQAAAVSSTPVNSKGDCLYLYTIPYTVEGDTIYIDGEEYIKSVVYHTELDGNQYLYLPKTVSKAMVANSQTSVEYGLSFDETNLVGVVSDDGTEKILIYAADGSTVYAELNNDGISFINSSSVILAGIVIDTSVYGGEGSAAYLDSVGIVIEDTLIKLKRYYYIDEDGNETDSSNRAFFPVSWLGYNNSGYLNIRGAVLAGTETEQTYYVTDVVSYQVIKASGQSSSDLELPLDPIG